MIRLATPEDAPAVMGLLERFHGENGIAPLNREKVEHEVDALIGGCDLFLADEEIGVVGALAICENVLWYSDQHTLADRFLYVVPEARGRTIGQMLLKAAKLEAERRNLPFFVQVTNPAKAQQRGRTGSVEAFYPIGWETRFR